MPRFLRFLPSLPDLTVAGAIDILVVAGLIYQCLMVVRGTRAGHILAGILVMMLLYGAALWAGLEALRSVLSFIVPYLGIAIIVLFQSEIRRTLARIGRKRWFGLARGFQAPESAGEILFAVERLAEKKIGALIVIERDIGLRTFVESGVRLDAFISRDLLLSIFQPGLPLHDGAVIVHKDRIAAAACFLPLTTNSMVSLHLGTRHRAAIGITEEADCLTLVVSEETGRISVAAFGELNQGLSIPEVTARINRHFGVRRPTLMHIDEFAADIPLAPEVTNPPVRASEKAAAMITALLRGARWTLRLIFENIGWKLLSLAAATAIWALVATEPELSTFASAQVEYKNMPDGVEIGSAAVTSVLLELRGPSGQLSGIGEASIHPQVILDMSSAAPGERTFAVDNGTVKLPRGVRLVGAIPSQIHFNFERRAEASVPVTVRIAGEGHDGYFLASERAQPGRLEIVGPASHVARVTQAATDAVDVSQVVGTSEFRVNAFLTDPYVRFQSSPQVEVTITMKKK